MINEQGKKIIKLTQERKLGVMFLHQQPQASLLVWLQILFGVLPHVIKIKTNK